MSDQAFFWLAVVALVAHVTFLCAWRYYNLPPIRLVLVNIQLGL